ncbi:MAG: PKD domain-containing protein, partial [Thermoplasmatota archaeon]
NRLFPTTGIGNYWTNYNGTDPNKDGIGDTPYPIRGNAHRNDNSPLVAANGWTALKTLPPLAVAGLDTFASPNVTLQFNGTSSYALRTKIVNYSWNFGDGTPNATVTNPTHKYTQTGTYRVTLTVTDQNGQSATDSLNAFICPQLQALANATATNGTLTIPACHYSQMVTLYHPITLRANASVVFDGRLGRPTPRLGPAIILRSNYITLDGITLTNWVNPIELGNNVTTTYQCGQNCYNTQTSMVPLHDLTLHNLTITNTQSVLSSYGTGRCCDSTQGTLPRLQLDHNHFIDTNTILETLSNGCCWGGNSYYLPNASITNNVFTDACGDQDSINFYALADNATFSNNTIQAGCNSASINLQGNRNTIQNNVESVTDQRNDHFNNGFQGSKNTLLSNDLLGNTYASIAVAQHNVFNGSQSNAYLSFGGPADNATPSTFAQNTVTFAWGSFATQGAMQVYQNNITSTYGAFQFYGNEHIYQNQITQTDGCCGSNPTLTGPSAGTLLLENNYLNLRHTIDVFGTNVTIRLNNITETAQNYCCGNTYTPPPPLYLHSNTAGDLVYLNNFNTGTVHANSTTPTDDGYTNRWDTGNRLFPTTGIGNYWTNYNGTDPNKDGIGDTPYPIRGNAHRNDNFPLMSPVSVSIGNEGPADFRACFSVTPSRSYAGRHVTLDAGCSFDKKGTIIRYEWDLSGNGTFASGNATIQTTFARPGTYSATLVVEDNQTRFASVTRAIVVDPLPKLAAHLMVTALTMNPASAIVGANLSLVAAVSNSGSGDAANFSVALTVDNRTSSSAFVGFLGSGTQTNVTLWWIAGSGGVHRATATADSTGAVYQTNTTGNARSVPIVIDFPPIASFSVSSHSAKKGVMLNFTDRSADPDGSVVAWVWSFGDGQSGTNRNPAHAFASFGNFTVRLTVIDNNGSTGTTTGHVLISDVPPVAAFTYTYTNATNVTVVHFQDASHDVDGAVANWSWNFGDSSLSWDRSPNHTYTNPGLYRVTLSVRDDGGVAGTLSEVVRIADEPIAVAFTASTLAALSQTNVTFTDKSVDPDGSFRAWQWSFGDGTNSSAQNPVHAFAHPGTYNVTLWATDSSGDAGAANQPIVILDRPPSVNFSTAVIGPTSDRKVSFTDRSFDLDGTVVSWSWAFGDGSSSTEQNPTHVFAAMGSFFVTLTIIDDSGSTNTTRTLVTLSALPIAPPERTNVSGSGSSPPSTSGNATTTGSGSSRTDTGQTIVNTTVLANGSSLSKNPDLRNATKHSLLPKVVVPGFEPVLVMVAIIAGALLVGRRRVRGE